MAQIYVLPGFETGSSKVVLPLFRVPEPHCLTSAGVRKSRTRLNLSKLPERGLYAGMHPGRVLGADAEGSVKHVVAGDWDVSIPLSLVLHLLIDGPGDLP